MKNLKSMQQIADYLNEAANSLENETCVRDSLIDAIDWQSWNAAMCMKGRASDIAEEVYNLMLSNCWALLYEKSNPNFRGPMCKDPRAKWEMTPERVEMFRKAAYWIQGKQAIHILRTAAKTIVAWIPILESESNR